MPVQKSKKSPSKKTTASEKKSKSVDPKKIGSGASSEHKLTPNRNRTTSPKGAGTKSPKGKTEQVLQDIHSPKKPHKGPSQSQLKEKKKTSSKKSSEAKAVIGEIVDSNDEYPPGEELNPNRETELEAEKAYIMSQKGDSLDLDPAFDETTPTRKRRKPAKSEKAADSKDLVPIEKSVNTTDPLLLYLNEIRRYPLLTREEEMRLAEKYFRDKDSESAQKLVKSNLRFVVKVAAEYSKFGAKMIDLIQEGNIGLLHAVKEFNPYKGARLITYAVWWIRGYIQEYLMRQYSMVRIGTTQNQRRLFYQLQKEQKALEALGQKGDFKQLAERLDMPEEDVREMALRMGGRDLSLDRPMDDDSEASLMDFQKSPTEQLPDQELELNEQLQILRDKIDELRPQLNEKELILLEERLLADDPLTLQEIGEKYKITREAVRQSEVRLMNKIKSLMGQHIPPAKK